MGEPSTQVSFGQLGDGEQDRERHVLTDDRGRLEQPLVLGREPVDPDGQDSLDCGRNLDLGEDLLQPVRAVLAHERLGSTTHERSPKERVARVRSIRIGGGARCPVLSRRPWSR